MVPEGANSQDPPSDSEESIRARRIDSRKNDGRVRDRYANDRFPVRWHVHVAGSTNFVPHRTVASVAANVVKHFSSRRFVVTDPLSRLDLFWIGVHAARSRR